MENSFLRLTQYGDERPCSPTSYVGNCDSSVMEGMTSEECLLQRQLSNWNKAIEVPFRLLHHSHNETQSAQNSLERQFLYQDYLSKPIVEATPNRRRKALPYPSKETDRVLRGEDINDVPTSYIVSGLKSYELPVIGTYVHKSILPGFRYRVRLNQSTCTKFIFGAKSLRLISVSLGYGKRLTFESESLNDNANYFWSDSQPDGYAFSVVALESGDYFCSTIHKNKMVVDEVFLQEEIETKVRGDHSVVKVVKVEFSCKVQGQESISSFSGTCHLVLPKSRNRTKNSCYVEKIACVNGEELTPFKGN